MFNVVLKGILTRKLRLLLTAFAVVLGTAFLSGSFIFTDTIGRTFDDLFADINANTDAVVRSSIVIEGDFGSELRNRIPDAIVAEIEQVPGVKFAVPQIQASAAIFTREGKPMKVSGPTFGGNDLDSAVSPWIYAEGRAPTASDEVAIDAGSAKKEKYQVGEKITINGTRGTEQFTLVGIVKFGTVDSPGGASQAIFTLETAQSFLLPQRIAGTEVADWMIVKGDGSVGDKELATKIAASLGDDELQVLTGAEITKENQSDVRKALNFFIIFLTVFALVALFVGSFVIANVFSISQAQRLKENALLRAIGATSRQVVVASMLEALAIGIIGSLLGFVGGIGLAAGIKALLGVFSIDIPSVGLVILPRTVILTLVVGTLITLFAALFPSLKAGRIKPVEAMRSSAIEAPGANRGRVITGSALFAIGAGAILFGLFGKQPIFFGLGALVLFVALYVLLPLVAAPIARLLGGPVARSRGITGRMAVDNASRNPRRTARTAAALMVGVALVSGVQVAAASTKSSIRDIFGRQFTGDYAVTLDTDGGGGPVIGGFNTEFTDELNAIDGVGSASGISISLGLVDGKGRQLTVVDPASVGDVFDLKFTSGSINDLTAEGIVVSEKRAEKDALTLGSPVEIKLIDGQTRNLKVQGIYAEDVLAGAYTVSRDLFATTTADIPLLVVFASLAPGADKAAVTAALESAVKANGLGKLQTRDAYIADRGEQLNQLVGLVYGLLGLSVVIAFFGIVLALALSVLERKKELALARAVGMTKRQVSESVGWESVITSLLGTVVGVIVGLLLGYALVASLRDQGFNTFTIPVAAIIVMLVLSVIVGILASIYPSIRANKVDIVEALAST